MTASRPALVDHYSALVARSYSFVSAISSRLPKRSSLVLYGRMPLTANAEPGPPNTEEAGPEGQRLIDW